MIHQQDAQQQHAKAYLEQVWRQDLGKTRGDIGGQGSGESHSEGDNRVDTALSYMLQQPRQAGTGHKSQTGAHCSMDRNPHGREQRDHDEPSANAQQTREETCGSPRQETFGHQ